MKKRIFIAFWSCLTLNSEIISQWDYGFLEDQSPVMVDTDTLDLPWTGGLTAPQWSPIDFDSDGDEDLFAFDRDGYRLLAFERTETSWSYRPDWVKGWPELREWCLLRDYNCDGKPDIFTGNQNSIYVYQNNTVDPTTPLFDPVATPLLASYDFGAGADMLPIVTISLDIPAIQDLDNDGDLDIITFTSTSSTLYKYEGLDPCGLNMECTNRCYGMLKEATENNALYIGDEFECAYNVVDPRAEQRHAGGTLTALQLDNSGPMDLLIGDVTYPTIIGVILEDAYDGLDSAAFVDATFPLGVQGIEAIDCRRFPAAYHLDVDADGVRDLLFSPNTYLETDDDASVHFMRNVGEELNPTWEYVTNTFLQEEMVDFGRGAYPVIIDLDGDDILDLVVSNKEQYIGVNETPSSVVLFKNTGTPEHPVFTKETQQSIDITTYGIESSAPAIGDLDGDGDMDIILGDELGRLHYFENLAGGGVWPQYEVSALSISDNSGTTIDIGQFATPQLIDVNSDELLDLIVGEKNGILNLFLNCGTPNSPSWCQLITDEFGEAWGNIHVANALGINGYSTPALVEDSLGIHILASNELGTIQYFGLVSEDLVEEHFELTSSVLNHASGYRSACSFADFNSDGKLDCLIGIQNGGLRCYSGSDSVDISIPLIDFVQSPRFKIYPNPGSGVLNWTSEVNGVDMEVFNTTGIVMFSSQNTGISGSKGSITTDSWPSGMYIVTATKTGSPLGPPALWVKIND